MDEAASDLVEQFEGHLDLSVDEIKEQMQSHADEYNLPVDEAKRLTENDLMDKAGIESDEVIGGGDKQKQVADINQDENWIDVRVKFTEEWEPRSDSIAQVGLVGDESGEIKFVAFETSDLPKLESGECYELENVVTDEYEGDYSIKLNRTTVINEIDDEIEVGDNTETIEGALVNVRDGSGLIERCTEDGCTRTLTSGVCKEHGEVDGENDLRIIAHLDDGTEVTTVVFNRELTEELTGIDLDTATEMAEKAMDKDVVGREVNPEIRGDSYRLTGRKAGEYFVVEGYEVVTDEVPDSDKVLAEAEAI